MQKAVANKDFMLAHKYRQEITALPQPPLHKRRELEQQLQIAIDNQFFSLAHDIQDQIQKILALSLGGESSSSSNNVVVSRTFVTKQYHTSIKQMNIFFVDPG